MEYIDVLNIAIDARFEVGKLVRHEMKKNLRAIELSRDKEYEIMRIIKALEYEKTIAGNCYINSDYDMELVNRESITGAYINSNLMKRVEENKRTDFIKKDVECFYTLFQQEVELRKLLASLKQQDSDKDKDDSVEYSERTINEEALKRYFTAAFKGAGNNNINYFKYLIEDIKKVRNPKEAARMALIIYESDKMIKTQKPNTFKEWYRSFCDMTGCTYNPDYKPSNLDTNKMKIKLSYL